MTQAEMNDVLNRFMGWTPGQKCAGHNDWLNRPNDPQYWCGLAALEIGERNRAPILGGGSKIGRWVPWFEFQFDCFGHSRKWSEEVVE